MISITKAGIALFAGTLLGGGWAYADEVAITCGPSTGSTYYMAGGLARSEHQGWQKDGIDAGFQLVLRDDKKLDLVSTRSPPNDFKYSDHGCELASVPLSAGHNELVVMSHCPRQIEVFLFQWKDDGTGEVVRVDVASSGLSKHRGALHADCRLAAH
jgi:hypothetical protein